MLRKLFKHEFKETAKLLLPLDLVLLAVTVIGCILLGSSILQNESLQMLSFSCMMIYILSIFALFIITAVYLTVRFYKTMYAAQGYLTHTLPVSTISIIHTKLLTAVFWLLIAAVITTGSIFLLIRIAAGNDWDPAAFSIAADALYESFGIPFGEFMSYIILSVLFSCFSMVLMIFASLSVGQLFGQHRILAAVVTYIVFYIIQQIISMIVLFAIGIGNTYDFSDEVLLSDAPNAVASFYRGTFITGIIEALVFAIAFYITGRYITCKHLNLE